MLVFPEEFSKNEWREEPDESSFCAVGMTCFPAD